MMTKTDIREAGSHGQMPMEEDHRMLGGFGTPTVTVTQYGLGARGIDWFRNKVGSDPETVVFPIYDGHGNMIYTLTREANDAHDLGNERIYGAWGDLRIDSNPGDGPNTQYVGNLGHKKDNESGLTYMRARYYEPWTGRFISEDPAMSGWNWFRYCSNDPINRVDPTGQEDFFYWSDVDSWINAGRAATLYGGLGLIAYSLSGVAMSFSKFALARCIAAAQSGLALVAIASLSSSMDVGRAFGLAFGAFAVGSWMTVVTNILGGPVAHSIQLEFIAASRGAKTHAAAAILGALAYSMTLWALAFSIE